jgi:hypothetical protein
MQSFYYIYYLQKWGLRNRSQIPSDSEKTTSLSIGALRFVILSISGDEAIAQALSWFLGMFVFTCECMGGMSSVALTDAIQLTPFMLTS